jgi:hypothetical protein
MFILREDLALKNWLSGIKVSDGVSSMRPVQVWFTLPEVEVRSQSYPYITIDLIDIRQSNERQASGTIYDADFGGTVAPEDGVVYSYEYPVTYDLYYQITTYSRNPRHDRALLNVFMKYATPGKYGHLPLPNDYGTDDTNTTYEWRHMFVEGFVKRDVIEDNRRLFRNTITVRVLTELTQEAASNALYEVENVDITTNISSIPTGYTPVQDTVTSD